MNLQVTPTASLQRLLPEARLKKYQLNLATETLFLWLINPEGWHQGLSTEQAAAVFESPPYWSFCWGSGLALAEWIINHPELFRNKSVLDVGSGSGVVAIAAARAGAGRVIACDIDSDACAAIAANAALNNVQLEIVDDLAKHVDPVDYVFAADLLYDPENLKLVESFLAIAKSVLIADSRVKNFSSRYYRKIEEIRAVTIPDLGENEDVKQVRLYESIPDVC